MRNDHRDAYRSDLQALRDAVGRLLTRAKNDAVPTAQQLLDNAPTTLASAKSTILGKARSLFATPIDPWVEAIPAADRTPARLLAHPDLHLRKERHKRRAPNTRCVAWVDVKGAGGNQPTIVSILRLTTTLGPQGEVMPHTPVVTLETLPAMPNATTIHAAIAAGVAHILNGAGGQDRTIVLVGSRTVSERAQQIKSGWVRTPGTEDWSAFDAAVGARTADVRWLSRTSKDFPVAWFAKTPA